MMETVGSNVLIGIFEEADGSKHSPELGHMAMTFLDAWVRQKQTIDGLSMVFSPIMVVCERIRKFMIHLLRPGQIQPRCATNDHGYHMVQ